MEKVVIKIEDLPGENIKIEMTPSYKKMREAITNGSNSLAFANAIGLAFLLTKGSKIDVEKLIQSNKNNLILKNT